MSMKVSGYKNDDSATQCISAQ